MPTFRVTVDEEAMETLDMLVHIFDSSRSNIVEALILEHYEDYANARSDELNAWIAEAEAEAEDQDEDEDLDEDEDEEDEG